MSAQTNPRSEQEEEIATKTTEPGHGVHSKPLRAFDGGRNKPSNRAWRLLVQARQIQVATLLSPFLLQFIIVNQSDY